MKLIFTDLQDIHDPWGEIQFGADSLKFVGNVAGLAPMSVHFVELIDGRIQLALTRSPAHPREHLQAGRARGD